MSLYVKEGKHWLHLFPYERKCGAGPFFVQLRFRLPPQIPDDEACDGFPRVCGVTMKGDVLLSLHVRQASPQEKKC